MLRATQRFENDAITATAEVEEGDDPREVVDRLRKFLDETISIHRDEKIRTKFNRELGTPEGRRRLERALGEEH